jgi:hypothetical protein
MAARKVSGLIDMMNEVSPYDFIITVRGSRVKTEIDIKPRTVLISALISFHKHMVDLRYVQAY